MVGSYNMDMRSTYINTELMLVVDSGDLNAKLREGMEYEMARSRFRGEEGGYEEGAFYEERELKSTWKAVYTMLRVVMPPIRHLL